MAFEDFINNLRGTVQKAQNKLGNILGLETTKETKYIPETIMNESRKATQKVMDTMSKGLGIEHGANLDGTPKLTGLAKTAAQLITPTRHPLFNAIQGGIDIAKGGNIGDELKETITNSQLKPDEEKITGTTTGTPTGTPTETATETPTETPTEKAESNLKKLWEREDAIRKETQAREDSAYQRAVADMRKAGINPNLVGINPAQSGGGITQASQMESTISATISSTTQQIIAELEREMDVKENQKDRITDIISSALMALLLRR